MHPPFTRRKFLKNMAAASATGALAGCVSPATHRHAELIRRENTQPGTRDWMLNNTRIDPATKFRCPWIEGYCSHTSIRAGETLSVFVSTNPASAFALDVYRLGYYGGTGARLMRSFGRVGGMTQSDPSTGSKRLRDCQWEPSIEFRIPRDWISGVYLGKLTAGRDGAQSYVIFIVRDDRQADFIFQCSDNTWQAYNRCTGR